MNQPSSPDAFPPPDPSLSDEIRRAPLEPVSQSLEEALDRVGLSLPPLVVRNLDAYCRLLWRHNEQLNLTRHTHYDLFAGRDVWDACQLAAVLEQGEEILDVGSGGGVPGMLLAILREDLDVSLCESVAKKARVLADMAGELGLPTPVHHARAEDLLDDLRFDTLTARAVGPLWKICKWFQPHWGAIGRVVLIKGPKWVEERGEARHRGLLQGVELRKIREYAAPGLDGTCVLLQLQRASKP